MGSKRLDENYMTGFAVVGKSVLRVDALEKVTGKAKYTMDLKLPGMLYGKILRSPYAHGRIVNIDTSIAEKLPGVKAVVTAQDAPDVRYGRHLYDQYLFAKDVVRFIGDPVAAVAATTREIAEEALDLIEVEYRELPAVFDPEEAAAPDPPVVIHPDLYSYGKTLVINPQPDPERPNVHNHFKIRHGDAEKGFKEADTILENKFTAARIQHCQMEPHSAIAQPMADGSMVMWAGGQMRHNVRSLMSGLFNVPPSKIRMISSWVGGGFGGKISLRPEPVAFLLARKTGRPVRVAFSREEVFVCATTRIPMIIYIKDGVKRDGTIVAREMRVFLNGGAYADSVPMVARNCSFGATGSYRIPNFKWDSYGVYTNEPIGGPFRGLGSTQVIWAIESHMDMVAEQLGLDPVEFRLKNILREGDANVTGEITHSIGARECLETVAAAAKAPQKAERLGPQWRVGWGVALGNKYSMAPTVAGAAVKVHEDGTLELLHHADEIGQGCNTVLAQIVAEEFGTAVSNVKVTCGDTAVGPYDGGSFSSRVTYNTGNAVRLAAQDAKRQMFQIASGKLEVPPEELETRNGRISIKGNDRVSIGIPDLFAGFIGDVPGGYGSYVPGSGELVGKGLWIQSYAPESKETGQIDPELARKGMRLVAFYIHGAQAVQVAVNVETGEVKVLKVFTAFDMGRAINPKLCEAQIEGGMGMGIGNALYEEMVLDNGAVLNPTFMDYKLPTAAEMPVNGGVAVFMEPAPHKDGPYGAKGLGEGVMVPTAPAIANAIYNATGVRLKDMPMTRERLLKELRSEL